MILTFIAAIGKNNELGKGGNLVWRLPDDLKHFHERTSGHTMIMGRKTFESIGRVLPNRRNVIITRDTNYKIEGAEVAHSLDEALDLARTSDKNEPARNASHSDAGGEIFIIGGAEIFKKAMNVANRLDITHIEAQDKDADTFFPEFNNTEWKVVSEEFHPKDEKHPYNFTFRIYERI